MLILITQELCRLEKKRCKNKAKLNIAKVQQTYAFYKLFLMQ